MSPWPPNPYLGPRSFTYDQELYGRDRESSELRDLLIADRIVLMYSPSGAGKTSLIDAGLRKKLEARRFAVLPTIRVATEGADRDGLAGRNRYLASTIRSLEEHRSTKTPESVLRGIRDLPEYLNRIAADLPPGHDPCLVFDQFEELLTLDPTDVEKKAEFMYEVGRALSEPRPTGGADESDDVPIRPVGAQSANGGSAPGASPIEYDGVNRRWWALFSMREDFVAQLDPYLRFITTRFRTRFRLDLLGVEAAIAAIRKPALAVDVDFSADAARELVNDLRKVRVMRGGSPTRELGRYVEPVQLQVVCELLWNEMSSKASA